MLLTRAQTLEARAALEALSRSFLAARLSLIADPSLAGGLAGLALVHAALDAAFPGVGHGVRAQRALGRAIDLLATATLSPSLYSGFSGVAWVAELLSGDPNAQPEDDPNAEIDAALETYLAQSPWTRPYDLIEGLVGIGVYALERMPRPSAKRMLALVVDRLKETAQRRRPGIAWWSDPQWVPAQWRRMPHPDWNLGVAHGVPGVIALLGRIAAAGVDAPTHITARALLNKAVAWLLAQELPRGAAGRFAYAVARGAPREPARLAWCYGDAGVAAALLVAARAVREPAWEKVSLRIALHAAARTEATARVVDAGLCHGAAGVAHIFHRIYLATGAKRIAAASRAWFERALAMRKPGLGFGGFLAYVPVGQEKLAGHGQRGFLEGSGGVTLALLAATMNSDPAWDRALLLS
jgi:lantibiotic biosynthesis protein